MAYTSNDSPAIVQRINGDMQAVLQTVREGDPRLRALVLTGGFARGEGTVVNGVPQNDYDFVAIRGPGRPRTSYPSMAKTLHERLGIHIDLAPVPAWRLRWTEPSIFWYETALRGRTLWGKDLLAAIPTREPRQLRRTEGLRLLVNRAAGLLLATEQHDAHAVRIQAAKALLAAFDSEALCAGLFAPSQSERWKSRAAHDGAGGRMIADWTDWAYRFKVQPHLAHDRDPEQAWRVARTAILAAVPGALEHAGLPSLQAYARGDSLVERLVYSLRAHRVQGARRLLLNPTGRIRAATLALLEAAPERDVSRSTAARCLDGICAVGASPLQTLAGLRAATLQ